MKILGQEAIKRGEARGKIFAALLFLFLFPYLCSYFGKVNQQELNTEEDIGKVWVAQDRLWGTEKIPLEEYLVGMMAATIPAEYETEALKAQAILLRSWCMSLVEKKEGVKQASDAELKASYLTPEQCRKLWGEAYAANIEKIRQAVADTSGMILVWQGNIIAPPFFRVSNGSTRDVAEYLAHHQEWGYLKKTECPEDVEAAEYVSYIQINQKDFKKKIASLLGQAEWDMEKIILCRDSADYVKKIQVGDQEIEGEAFRYEMGLPSACFTLDKEEGYIEFQARGMGHGFGFSQYKANELAKEGNGFLALLQFFFSDISLEKM